MNKHLLSLALVSGLFLTTGCSDEQTAGTTDINEPVKMQIAPRVTLTRSVIDGGAQSADGATLMQNIAVYAQSATTNTAAKKNNYAVYTQSSGSWNTTGNDEIFLTSEAATVYAYYPAYQPGVNKEYATSTALKLSGDADANSTIDLSVYTGGAGTDANYTIAAISNADKIYSSGWVDNTAADKAKIASAPGEIDYMWGTSSPATVDNGKGSGAKGKTAALTMNHALALVSFRIYNDGTYNYNAALTQIKLENNAGNTTLSDANGHKMNISTGTISGGTAKAATYIRKVSGYTMIQTAASDAATTATTDAKAAAASKKLSMLVLPAITVSAGQVKATFTIDGVDYSVNLTTDQTDAQKWERGKNYLYTVKLGGQGLTIGSITVVDWSPVDGGNMEIN